MEKNLATKLELQEAKEKIRHTLRNEFTPMIHWLADSIDTVKWMLTKQLVQDAKQKAQIKNLEKAISSHTTTEDKDMEEIVVAIKDLAKSIAEHKEYISDKLEWKISFTMFWTLAWALVWIIMIVSSSVFNKVEKNETWNRTAQEALIRVETLINEIHNKKKDGNK